MIAVREALAAIGDGCPPSEIVIAARDLGPYSAALEEALDGEQLPWTSSLTAPLRRQPAVHDFLLLLKIVRDDFPRRATAELLRSSRVRWSELLPQGAWLRGDRADVWSRRARIIGGLEEWSRDLPEWAARPILFRGQGEEEIAEAERRADDRVEVTRTIAHVLSALGDRVAAEPRTWAAHARQLSELVDGPRSLIAWRDDAASTAARAALADLIDEMGRLDLLLEPDRPVPFDEVLRWLEETVDSFEQPLHRKDNGGIRVLDATQLRGITCNQLHFLGLNSGRFPRIAREDPILPDSARARLRTRSGRPLSVKKQGGREERLLLALILGAARERVDVSWQRADESGKAKTPSLALREVARIALGSPDFLPLRERESKIARHLRSHPAQWLQGLAEAPGVLSPADEMLLTALASGGAEAAEEVTARYPELGPGIAMLRATEAFRFMDTAYDGRIGARPRPDVLSVSALETLARCPLQYFFDRVLRVRELDAPATFLEVEPREIGLAIHELLEKTYSTLIHEGLFAAGDSERAAQRAVELLQEKRTRLFGDLSEKLSRRVPVLWEHFRRSWLTSLEAFVRNDLARLIDNGWEPVDLERDVSQVLDFGEDTHQRIRGRFDRQLASDAGTLVGDYKTSRNPAARAKPIKMLKGEALQVPLYWKMAGEQATVELLGVGPRVLPDSDVHYAEFKGFASPEQSRGFDETVRVLLELLGAGSFPLHSENHCQWCIYAQACRRAHPPTVAREENAADARDYRSLSRKQTRRPLLADVRGTS
jgi:ATP-dependent helicase/nuclease subunit B